VRRLGRGSLLPGILIALAGCEQTAPFDRDAVLAATIGTTAIYFHRNTGDVDSLEPLLLDAIRLALDSIGRVVPVTNVQLRVVVLPEAVLPGFGLSGAVDSSRIDLFLDPTHPNLRLGIAEALTPTLAHEFHHVLRNRTAGYGTTLLGAMVSEGLAEHFVIEVTGRPAPWTGSLTQETRGYWRRRAAAIWCSRDFDHAAWFIATVGDIPRGTGFEVGADIVGEYLAAHPGERPSALHAAPTRLFLPAELRGDAVADCWPADSAGP